MEELGAGDPGRIGPYELLGKLGSGGMGRVYLGRSAAGALAAVKVIHPDLARDPEFRRRFQREVAATVAVSGPHVAAIVHADTEAEQPWLATEYVAGPSLAAAVAERGSLPLDEVAALGSRLAGALAAIHAAGLVHRDVKPSNILLGADGPKLIDFGIARDTADSRLTRTGVAMGTPLFMAPEQIQGDSGTGPAADVFALAGVLLHAMTGRYPFGEGTAVQLLFRIVHEEPRLDEVAPELRPLLAACLDKDPVRRPSAEEVAAALGAIDPGAAETWPGIAGPDPDEVATERLAPGSVPTQSAVVPTEIRRAAPPGSGPQEDLATVTISRFGPAPHAAKRKQKAYVLTGTGVAAAIVALVVALSGGGGANGSQAGSGTGAGLAGAASSSLPNGAGPGGPTPGGSAAGVGATPSPGQIGQVGPTTQAGVTGGAAPNPPSATSPSRHPTGSSSATASAPPGSHSGSAPAPSSAATSSAPPPKTSSSSAPATPPACGTDYCSNITHQDAVVRSVSANKCLVPNTNGTQYMLQSLGSCSGTAARWRVWWDSGQLRAFMLESLYFPGYCLGFGEYTLAPCRSDDVKKSWWISSASGQHRQLTGYPYLTSCASVDSTTVGLAQSDCQTPSVDWQQWDIQ